MHTTSPLGGSPDRLPGLVSRLRDLYARRETVRYLTVSGLRAAHRDKVLGHLWSVLDPLLLALVFYVVFGILFGQILNRARSADFLIYILSGILIFRFFETTVSQASTCIRANKGLIHNIGFPKAVFPASIALSRLYDLLWGLVVLCGFLLLAQVWPTAEWFWLPVLILLSLALAMGTAFIIAYLGAFFADTTNVVFLLFRLGFYCSPIFYFVRDRGGHASRIQSDTIVFWYLKNPIAALMECYRDALLWPERVDLGLVLYVAVIAGVTWLLGFTVFSRAEGSFAKYV